MDLEENGYVQKRIRFFMGLNFITLSHYCPVKVDK